MASNPISTAIVKTSIKTQNIVVSKKSTTGTISTEVPVTLKNIPTMAAGVNSFDELDDVNLAQRTDGSVPIYDQPTNTYVVKHLEFTEIDGDLDGGIF